MQKTCFSKPLVLEPHKNTLVEDSLRRLFTLLNILDTSIARIDASVCITTMLAASLLDPLYSQCIVYKSTLPVKPKMATASPACSKLSHIDVQLHWGSRQIDTSTCKPNMRVICVIPYSPY